MADVNAKAFELLGKYVSFIHERKLELTDTSFITFTVKLTGIVTNVVLGLTTEPEISINNDGDFYCLSELIDFKII